MKLAWQIYAWAVIGAMAIGTLIYVVNLFRLLQR